MAAARASSDRFPRDRDSVATKYRRNVSRRPSGSSPRKLSRSVHSSGSNTQPSNRSNGFADGALVRDRSERGQEKRGEGKDPALLEEKRRLL
jgi:hypothetical protein